MLIEVFSSVYRTLLPRGAQMSSAVSESGDGGRPLSARRSEPLARRRSAVELLRDGTPVGRIAPNFW